MTVQVLKGIAVCLKQGGLPTLVVIGDEKKAKKYMEKETSIPVEQFGFLKVNVVFYDEETKIEKKNKMECYHCKDYFDEEEMDLQDGDWYCRNCETELDLK